MKIQHCKPIISLLIVFSTFQVLYAQNTGTPNYVESITQENLLKHLSILASDSLEGREAGKKGQEMAADYLVNQFKSYGLVNPVPNSKEAYQQLFSIIELEKTQNYIQIKSKKLYLFDDFVVFTPFVTNKIEQNEFVWAGYGIDHPKYSDYANLDVKDKIVIIATGEPQDEKGLYWLSKDSTKASVYGKNTYKQQTAFNKGAKAVFMMPTDSKEFKALSMRLLMLLAQDTLEMQKEEAKLKICYLSVEAASTIFDISSKQLLANLQKINLTRQNSPEKYIQKAGLKIKDVRVKLPTANVLGFLEGTDKKEEVLVISAHYDHVGIVEGKIHNGADDDASGTSAVLEMARAFAKAAQEGVKPKRSILFALFSAEEKGLLGSKYYTENPVFSLKNTVTNLNIDMIGRVDDDHKRKPYYLYIIGSDRLSKELHKLNLQIAKKTYPYFKFDFLYDREDDENRYFYRSDHYNFAKNNVPVVFYFDGGHEDYHKPTDDFNKIDLSRLEHTTKLIFHVAWELAFRENRVSIDKNK